MVHARDCAAGILKGIRVAKRKREDEMFKIATAVCTLCVVAGAAHAAEIYAVNNLANSGGDNTLIRFDSSNPAGWTTIGSLGHAGIGFGGLDFSGAGDLYAYASFGSRLSGLYRVDTGTGAATLVGDSGQSLQDLAWNPVTNTMYGVNTTVPNVATIYSVNLADGSTSAVGNVVGLPAVNLEVGLAVDSAGRFFVHDIASDTIYRTDAGLNVTASIVLSRDTNFSQGMTIDWSRDDAGYHAAIGNSPAFFSRLFGFDTSLTGWNDLGDFGAADGTFPTVEGGDLAIRPVPAPGALALLGLGSLAATRRRRA